MGTVEEREQEARDEAEFNRRSEEFWAKPIPVRSRPDATPVADTCPQCEAHGITEAPACAPLIFTLCISAAP